MSDNSNAPLGKPPVGELFSRVYLDSGQPQQDSKRLRFRISEFYRVRFDGLHLATNRLIREELGVPLPETQWESATAEFFKSAELRDFLSAITLAWRAIYGGPEDQYARAHYHRGKELATEWANFVERAMREENVAYTIDEFGGVHFYVDQEFQRGRAQSPH